MSSVTRIAVLGLYNSGSTCVARMLHQLGVNMGPPFWQRSDEGAPYNYYEPNDLAWHLRKWWDEPRCIEQVPPAQRIRYLQCWAALQECAQPGPLGAKHPLLSLCGDDLIAAWGPETRLIWSWRPLEESIARLKARGWFPGFQDSLQRRLWAALNELRARRGDVIRLDWACVLADPMAAARELASVAGIIPDDIQLQSAAGIIRT